MFGYLPTTTFALWPFTTWLPTPIGATLFGLSNVACAIGSLWLLRKYWIPQEVAVPAFAAAAALIAVNLAHAIQANQTTLWTLFFCVAGLTYAFGKRPFVGGLLVGLAALIKTMPLLLVGLLLLRGKWRSLAGFALALVLFDVVPSVAFFGVEGAIDEHRAWARRAGWHSNGHMIREPMLRVHRHGNNSAYAAVLTRWLRAPAPDNVTDQIIVYGDAPPAILAGLEASRTANEIITRDPMPARDGGWTTKRVHVGWVPRWHLANLSAVSVWWMWATTVAAALTSLMIITILPRFRCAACWPAVASLWMLAMFWPSPMMRHYYLAWAAPAIVVVVAAVAKRWSEESISARLASATSDFPGEEAVPIASRRSGGVPKISWLPALAILMWIVGVMSIGWRTARWYGIHLAALAILAAAVVWALQRTRRQAPAIRE